MIAYEESEVPATAGADVSPNTHIPNPHARPRLSLASAVSSVDDGDSSDYEAAGRSGSRRFATRTRFRSKYGDRPVVGAGLLESSDSEVDVPVTSDSGDEPGWPVGSARQVRQPSARASGRALLPPLSRPASGAALAPGASDDDDDDDGDDVGAVVEVSGGQGGGSSSRRSAHVSALGRARAAGMAARWAVGKGKGRRAGQGTAGGASGREKGARAGPGKAGSASGAGASGRGAGNRRLPRPQSSRIFPELDVANEEDREYMGSRCVVHHAVVFTVLRLQPCSPCDGRGLLLILYPARADASCCVSRRW